MSESKPAANEKDFLVTVARSIGSTLGSVVAKVSPSPRASRRSPARSTRARKQTSKSRGAKNASRKAHVRKAKA